MAASLGAEVKLTGNLQARLGMDLDNYTWGLGQLANVRAELGPLLDPLSIDGQVLPVGLAMEFFAQPELPAHLQFRTAALELGDASRRYGAANWSFLLGADGAGQNPPVAGGVGLLVAWPQWFSAAVRVASPLDFSDESRFFTGSRNADARALSCQADLTVTPGSDWRLDGSLLSGFGYKLPQPVTAGLRGEYRLVDLGPGWLSVGAGFDARNFIYLGKELAWATGAGVRWNLPGPRGVTADLWGLNSDVTALGLNSSRVYSGLSADVGLTNNDDPLVGPEMTLGLSWYQSRRSGLVPNWGSWAAFEGQSLLATLGSAAGQVQLALTGGVEAKTGVLVGFVGLTGYWTIQATAATSRYFLRVGGGAEELVPGVDYRLSWESNDLVAGYGTWRDRLGKLVNSLVFRF